MRAFVTALMATTALVAVLVLAGCGGSSGSGSSATSAVVEDDTGAEEAAVADAVAEDRAYIQAALDLFNESNSRGLLTSYAQRAEVLGDTARCVVGFSVDFPEYVLVTVVSSAGPWAQLSIHPQNGLDLSSFNYGSDYRSARFDESFWESGYECSVDASGAGRIDLAP